ncbi:hypothetical protein EW026_g3917 [Hermanssonia centrifuga]|uniref:Uncharacterized protein n=1 Tax=Hermanssonia centrifuga TaxID=98765 RepID=A0A4S4KIR3_9APHY|nr:hypothetical protein EW026_g3917 [Hermanssonia centrifuga]
MVQEYESHHGSLRHQSVAFFNVGYAPDAVDMGGMAAVPPLMTVDCMDLQLGHNVQSHAPSVAMGNNYQNAVMGHFENSVYPPLNMENNAAVRASTENFQPYLTYKHIHGIHFFQSSFIVESLAWRNMYR